MRERGVDFIIAPAYVGVAAELHTAHYWLYTAIWNILDQPCVTFPTGLNVDPKIDVVEVDYKPRDAVDDREYQKCRWNLNLQKSILTRAPDVPEKFTGAPIALQLVGKHFRDEETVAAAGLVSEIIQA